MFTARRFFTIAVVALLLTAGGSSQSMTTAPEEAGGLLSIKKLCVDKLAGDEALAGMVREMAIAGLFPSKRFIITEKCDSADGILKGAVLERGEKRIRGEGEAADFGAAAGAASIGAGGGSAGFGAVKGGSGETLFSAETRSQASVTLRLVDKEGTVVWAYTQDSPGGKTKGAVADATDRAVRQLLRDLERAGKRTEAAGPK